MQNGIIYHDHDRGLIICGECEFALVPNGIPSGIETHLRGKHFISDTPLREVLDYVQTIATPLCNPSNVGQFCQESIKIKGIKVTSGFACNIPKCTRKKGWLSKHERIVWKHLSKEHRIPDRRRQDGKLYTRQHPDQILSVKFQSIFNRPNYQPFIIHEEPNLQEINFDKPNHIYIEDTVTMYPRTRAENIDELVWQVTDLLSVPAEFMPVCQSTTFHHNYNASARQLALPASSVRLSSGLPRSPSPPEELRTYEAFFLNIKNYIVGAIDNGIFVDREGELINYQSKQSSENLKNFHVYCLTAIDLIDRNRAADGILWFRHAAKLIEQLLKEQDPRLLEILADVSVLLCLKNQEMLYTSLRDHMCAMVECNERDRQNQPWAQIFSRLQKLSASDLLAVISTSWKCGYDQFIKSPIGPQHATNISCYSNYLSRLRDKVSAGKEVSSILAQIVEVPGVGSQDLQLQYEYGKSLYFQKSYHQALKIMNKVILECEKAHHQGKQKWRVLEIDALEILARCYHDFDALCEKDRISNAEAAIQKAISKSGKFYGLGAASTLGLEYTAWIWLKEQKRNVAADDLMQKISTAMESTSLFDT